MRSAPEAALTRALRVYDILVAARNTAGPQWPATQTKNNCPMHRHMNPSILCTGLYATVPAPRGEHDTVMPQHAASISRPTSQSMSTKSIG